MNDGLIPNRYAKALFKYASEQGVAESVYAQSQQLASNFGSVGGMVKAVENPFLPQSDKEKVLLAASGADPDGCLGKFFKLVFSHGREAFLLPMALAYGRMYRSANAISQVEITTATELPDAELKKIQNYVVSYLGESKPEYTVKVNPELIGGFTVKVDSKMLDASLGTELRNLRLKLLSKK